MLRLRANDFPLSNSAHSLSTAGGWTNECHKKVGPTAGSKRFCLGTELTHTDALFVGSESAPVADAGADWYQGCVSPVRHTNGTSSDTPTHPRENRRIRPEMFQKAVTTATFLNRAKNHRISGHRQNKIDVLSPVMLRPDLDRQALSCVFVDVVQKRVSYTH